MPYPIDDLPDAARRIGEPPVNVGPLYQPNDYFRIVSLSQAQRYPEDGRIIPTIDVLFDIPGFAGSHELFIDNYAFTHADPVRDLRGRSKRIQRLYALPNPPPPDPEEL